MPSAREQAVGSEAHVVSADGTEIAFEQSGSEPVVVLVASALDDRSGTAELASLLSERFTVIDYNRRDRGAGGDAGTYSVGREIDDIAALIGHSDGPASLFGSSSGAVLAPRTATAGLGVDRLTLYN